MACTLVFDPLCNKTDPSLTRHAVVAPTTCVPVYAQVFDPEPLPKGHPLITERALVSEKLILTPHIGSATLFTRRKMLHLAMANMHAGLAGKPLPHPAL